MKRMLALFSIATLVTLLACGGGGGVGDACQTGGDTTECNGGVCTVMGNGSTLCQTICHEDPDCAPDGFCDQAAPGTSLKACRPNSDR